MFYFVSFACINGLADEDNERFMLKDIVTSDCACGSCAHNYQCVRQKRWHTTPTSYQILQEMRRKYSCHERKEKNEKTGWRKSAGRKEKERRQQINAAMYVYILVVYLSFLYQ